MSGAAVRGRGVAKRLGRAHALRGLDFDLEPGRGLAVLGPNGAGKSTLLRLLAGLARPSQGSLEVDGQPCTTPSARGRVGYVGHATGLSPSLTVRENLLFAARLHGVTDPARRADAGIEREGIEALAHRPAGALSRGQAQRVSIARALVHDPDLVLLDEPFTGLDRGAAERLATRLGELGDTGHTRVLVTHTSEGLRRLADSALVLHAGSTVFKGDLGSDADLQALDQALEGALANAEHAA